MKSLTAKEEEILVCFWKHGAMFVKDLLEIHPEPKPHYNTLSTIVRALEEKGFVDHKSYGNTYQYFAKVSQKEYRSNTISEIASRYFGNSYTRIVSSFIEEEKLDIDDLKALIDKIKEQGK